MSNSYDVIVVGLGAMGSAACRHLARRGIRTLGLEQFSIPHNWGSSHGHARMIRLVYRESPDYIPLLRRAYTLWHRLETETGRRLIHLTGGLFIGPAAGNAIAQTRQCAEQYDLDYSLLGADEIRRDFPQFHVPDAYQAIFDPNAGLVLPESAIATHAELALRQGADLHGHEPAAQWSSDGHGVTVRTPRETYSAEKLLICGGAWSARLLKGLGIELEIVRQVQVWTWPKRPELFEPGRMPVWTFRRDHTSGIDFYGFPMMPSAPGLKLGGHREYTADPDILRRGVTDADAEPARQFLKEHIPDGAGPVLSMEACMYTNSPDDQFIIDHHPAHPNVTFACGFSGHGFKFMPVVGEILGELVCDGKTKLPIDFLSLGRFGRRIRT